MGRNMNARETIEAKVQFIELLDRVADGESITITRDGEPIALLRPLQSLPKRNRKDVIADLLNFGKGRNLSGASIRDMIDDGRRF